MQWEMLAHSETAPQWERAADPASSFNTAAYCFTEHHPSAAANSGASPHCAADAYRIAEAYSGTAPLAFLNEREGH